MRVGVVGVGAIGLAMAAWLVRDGHGVRMWSPRAVPGAGARAAELTASGVVEARTQVVLDDDPADLVGHSDVILIALPLNAHRGAMDALLPHLRDGLTVIVSSMASLSALHLFEAARAAGRAITVASLGTTVLTARREGPMRVRVLARRRELRVSSLPRAQQAPVLSLCAALFGDGFSAESNALATTLSNINPIAHGPLALFNWTRIERAEAWPQYHYLTPRVAAVIMRLEAERLALAQAFGVQVRGIEAHFALSFGTRSQGLAAIAEELHAQRGGPNGPVEVDTRYLSEDVPFGLLFQSALGRIAALPVPVCDAISATASLVVGRDFAAQNDLIAPLGLAHETVDGLRARVNA